MPLSRIKGCAGRLVTWVEADDPAVDPEAMVADLTSFSLDESSEDDTFQVIGDCAEQVGEGTESYTLSGEGRIKTDAADGQSMLVNNTKVRWRFYLDFDTDPTVYYQGLVKINSRGLSVTPSESMSLSFSGVGDGALVKAGGAP